MTTQRATRSSRRPFALSQLLAIRRYAAVRLSLLLFRAALFRWMSPFRAARSSSFAAASLTSAVASGAFAFFSAVRRAERCARLRTVAARDLRMFFLADAIFGTKTISKNQGILLTREGWNLEFNMTKVKAR